MKIILSSCLLLILPFFVQSQISEGNTMQINSAAFQEGGMIPSRYTCDSQDVSPPLFWTGVLQQAVSLALIADDPDAPMGTWVHWVLYDIPADVTELPENVPPYKKPVVGGTHGITDFGRIGYGGPCPPSGTHRYYFKLYALDKMLSLAPGATKKQAMSAMKDHVLAEAQLMGKYRR